MYISVSEAVKQGKKFILLISLYGKPGKKQVLYLSIPVIS
jgi:hypothetical protein